MSDYADSGNLPRYFIPGLLFPTEFMFHSAFHFPFFGRSQSTITAPAHRLRKVSGVVLSFRPAPEGGK